MLYTGIARDSEERFLTHAGRKKGARFFRISAPDKIMLKEKYPKETLSVCYYLYSFEGALCDKHWDDIGVITKRELRQKIS